MLFGYYSTLKFLSDVLLVKNTAIQNQNQSRYNTTLYSLGIVSEYLGFTCFGMNTASKMCKPSEPREPSLFARYTCAGISCAIFAVWWKYTFVPETVTPGVDVSMHSWHTTALLTIGYLISLPLLKLFTDKFLAGVDVKILLKESMLLYNVAQVALNGWMVWRFVDAVVNKGHPFIGDISFTSAGTAYAVWVHYCDKYLEFFDTYFMILRGRMDQVCTLYLSIEFADLIYAHIM